jgi:hypothetical protein
MEGLENRRAIRAALAVRMTNSRIESFQESDVVFSCFDNSMASEIATCTSSLGGGGSERDALEKANPSVGFLLAKETRQSTTLLGRLPSYSTLDAREEARMAWHSFFTSKATKTQPLWGIVLQNQE